MTTSTTSRSSVRLVMRSLLRRTGRGYRSGTEARQDCDETRPAVLRQVVKLLIRPAPPTGPGAGNHERTGRTKARSQSFRGSHPRSPTHSPAPSGCVRDPHSHSAASRLARLDRPTPDFVRGSRLVSGGKKGPASPVVET